MVLRIIVALLAPQHFFTRQCRKAEGREPSVQPLESFPSCSLHCTVRLCQPVSQVLEQVIQVPVTHWGPGGRVEGPGSVGGVKTRTVGAGKTIVVLLVVVVVVLIVVETVVVLCAGVGFGLGMSGAKGC